MDKWTRCEYETDDFTCAKLADLHVKGYGPVCLDHMGAAHQDIGIRQAETEKSAMRRKVERATPRHVTGDAWECPHCYAENPDETKAGRLGFCLGCTKARETK